MVYSFIFDDIIVKGNEVLLMRFIKMITEKYKLASLELVEDVFSKYQDINEGKLVRSLVEEIRKKKYYLPELELIMVNDKDDIIGYCMFSKFHLGGKYEDELLLLSPVAVKTDLQRQHISKDLIEYGFKRAIELGYKAVIVEDNPDNYRSRGFITSSDYGIIPNEKIKLPHIECLMVKELIPGALNHIKGIVDYSFYETLTD